MLDFRLDDIARIAADSFKRASEVADQIRLPRAMKAFADTRKYARDLTENHAITDDPELAGLDHFEGIKAWGAMLSFDLRGSSRLAVDLGARDTYVLMHTYLPTMLAVVRKASGVVVGLRGDGAIAMFGVVKYPGGAKVDVTTAQAEWAVTTACDCGATMVKVMESVVNPILKSGDVSGPLAMGVGIDVGEFVATNIGLGTAHELTAYGKCVNTACKRSNLGHNRVVLTNEAREMFPKTKTGKTEFSRHPVEKDAYFLNYPSTYTPYKR